MFASHFGLHPDRVYDNTSFDTVAEFTIMWTKQDTYRTRFEKIRKSLTPPNT